MHIESVPVNVDIHSCMYIRYCDCVGVAFFFSVCCLCEFIGNAARPLYVGLVSVSLVAFTFCMFNCCCQVGAKDNIEKDNRGVVEID